MAIDTAAKRASVLSFAIVTRLLIPPDGTIAHADMQTLEHLYSGIAAGVIVYVPPTHLVTAGSRIRTASANDRTRTLGVEL